MHMGRKPTVLWDERESGNSLMLFLASVVVAVLLNVFYRLNAQLGILLYLYLHCQYFVTGYYSSVYTYIEKCARGFATPLCNRPPRINLIRGLIQSWSGAKKEVGGIKIYQGALLFHWGILKFLPLPKN